MSTDLPACERCDGAGVVPGAYELATNSWADHECPVCDGWGGPVCAVCRGPVLDGGDRYCAVCAAAGAADVWMTDREAS